MKAVNLKNMTEPKSRPMIMSEPMVLAILNGTKTQTRRIVKPQPSETIDEVTHCDDKSQWFWWRNGIVGDGFKCPYGKPGDSLWVRETWALGQIVHSIRRMNGAAYEEIADGSAYYRADGFDTVADLRAHTKAMMGLEFVAMEIENERWKSSIHMPRWASRIDLEITDIRVERLNSITEEDAKSEGAAKSLITQNSSCSYDAPQEPRYSYIPSFVKLWEKINGKGSSWGMNPWVWVIEFKSRWRDMS